MNKSEFKICCKCEIEKPLSEFTKLTHGYFRSYCNVCQNIRNKDRMKENQEATKKYRRERKLLNKYNITPEEYNDLLLSQEGRCVICNTHQKDLDRVLFVDHDHDTGELRGLLCCNCNSGIGLLNDDIQILEKAIKYLKRV